MDVKRLLLSVLALTVLAIALPAQESEEEQPSEFVLVYSPKNLVLDPRHIYTTMESELSTGIYEGLLSYHPFSLEPLPAVASEWKISPDRTVYTFTLRENARFSNGDPVQAQDFLDSWLRVLEPGAGAEYSFLFDVIKGARDYRLGREVEDLGIRVISPTRLEVELERPASHFLKILCHMTFAPIHSSYRNRERWDREATLIGNGPYYVHERKPAELVMKKNQLYWDASRVEIETLRIRFMDDPEAISQAFNNGEVHWTNNWDTELLLDRTKIVFNPLFATSYFFFVCNQEPWSDERVRRALVLLSPWEQIRNEEEVLLPTSNLIPGIPGYPEVEGIETSSRQEALRLLEEAGYPGGNGLPSLLFKLPGDSESRRIAEIMAEAWKAELDLKVGYQSFPFEVYLEEVKKADFTIGSATWIGDYADPLTFLQMWTADSNLNDARFSDEEFDALIERSFGQEGRERYQTLGESEGVLLQKAVVLPISHTPAFNLIDLDRVEGWFPNVLNIHPLKYLRFRALRLPPGIVKL
ncbi:MAG: peptide ABC transporter substrate-binding protein [Spirochaetaceae bacterium]|nr:MAG: peptide ABC transporter substrate-binding protein [Spirochaetaceae bacterium]